MELDGDVTRLPLAGLGGGLYAFVVAGWLGEVVRERPTAVGARFRLDGPALELTPTADVERTDPGGPAVVLEADPGLGEAVTYGLQPALDWEDAPTLPAEEAVLNPRYATCSRRTRRARTESRCGRADTRPTPCCRSDCSLTGEPCSGSNPIRTRGEPSRDGAGRRTSGPV
ncbi:hypothetical protein ACFQL1_00785 [Halomicroarcula sp. GCM10025709]|uniref:hypothetical protein n=1 Tax=Halomicroarcula sp. GCM10025709 TaxID=3252669 RepID=UPI00360924DD